MKSTIRIKIIETIPRLEVVLPIFGVMESLLNFLIFRNSMQGYIYADTSKQYREMLNYERLCMKKIFDSFEDLNNKVNNISHKNKIELLQVQDISQNISEILVTVINSVLEESKERMNDDRNSLFFRFSQKTEISLIRAFILTSIYLTACISTN